MENYLFLKPKFATALWGDGSILKRYGMENRIPDGMKADEVCAISLSGLHNDANEIIGGYFSGLTLDKVYTEHPELFKGSGQLRWEYMPVSMGICHACADLSVQVHPTEEYAVKNLGSHGKSECWYFINTKENGDIVIGHNANTQNELEDYVTKNDWENLLRRYPIAPEGFYNIQAGTLHAIQEGTTFIEVCNPSPVTYRFYDYDRKDDKGHSRELNLERAYENVLVPFEMIQDEKQYETYPNVEKITYTENENFSVFRYKVNGCTGKITMPKPYLLCFVIDGEGSVDGNTIKAGDGFVITADVNDFELNGNLTLLACHG